MSAALPETYLTRIAVAAREAENAEAEFRKSYTERLGALERARVFAHRRHALLKALSSAIEGADDLDAAFRAGELVLEQEFGLSSSSEAHKAILLAFRPVSDEIDTILNCEDEPDHSSVISALEEFERWYEAHTGSQFMALYDVYVQATPVVDF